MDASQQIYAGREAWQKPLPYGRGSVTYCAARVSQRLGEQGADELQVPGHVIFNGFRRAIRLQIGKSLESDIGNCLHHRRKIDSPFAQIMRVVLKVHLADPLCAEPTDLLHYIEAAVGGVSDVVIDLDGCGPGTLHDAHVVLG